MHPLNTLLSSIKRLRERFSFLWLAGSFIKWIAIAVLVGLPAGAASALFLFLLDWVTALRVANPWLIALLPAAGLAMGAAYYYLGQDVVRGNNQIIGEALAPANIIPFKMAPFILVSTVLTHLVGGSAGREGTGVQMGGAIADQFTHILKLPDRDRRTLLACGVSAGFASIFGTPLAGALFALEVNVAGVVHYNALVPALLAALVADGFARWLGAHHGHLAVTSVTSLTVVTVANALAAGVFFGLCGRLFGALLHRVQRLFARLVPRPPWRPAIGGAVLALLFLGFNNTRYAGLGLDVIAQSFNEPLPWYDFLLKTMATAWTLGAGFKGGEVTPLFFIGATLGSALSTFLALPSDLLAAMGLVAVFAAASNTPVTCLLLGIELFGATHAPFIAIGSFVAYLFSGHRSIYSAQLIGAPKHYSMADDVGRPAGEMRMKSQDKGN